MKNKKLELSVILLLICTVFWFAPMEFFFVNINSFWFDIYDLLPFAVLGTIVTFGGLFIFFRLLGRFLPRIRAVVICLLFSSILALYLQGNYFIGELGVLDGTVIEWSLHKKEAILSYTLWGSMLLFGGLLAVLFLKGKQQIEKIIVTISICLILVQIVTLITAGIFSDGFKKSVSNVPTTNYQFEMSSEENMIVLLLDSFDARAMDNVIEDVNCGSILKDFTWFRNTVGGYVYTDLAIPHIISGCQYGEEETYKEYVTRAYNESEWLNKLYNNNWRINIYTQSEGPQGELAVNIDNYEKVDLTVSSKRRLAKYMYRLVGFRYLPFPLKQYCWFYPDEMEDMRNAKDSEVQIYDWSNFVFYENMKEMHVVTSEPSMHLYHLEGTHIPYHISDKFELVERETSIEEEAQGVFILIDEFLSKLKENGIYDNSTIVIMADHGYEGYRQSPLFCVKGKSEKHEFEVTDIPLSYDDLQKAFCYLSEGAAVKDAFSHVPTGERKRTFWFYDLDYSHNINEQKFVVEEYVTSGNSYEDDSVERIEP